MHTMSPCRDVPLNAGCVPFGWEVIVSKTTSTGDVHIVGEETIVSEPEVPASHGDGCRIICQTTFG